MRYAREHNGKIERFSTLPRKISINGRTIMGLRSMTDLDLAGLGIYPLEIPTFNTVTQGLGDIVWDSMNNVFVYSVKDLDADLSGAKKRYAKQLKEIVISVHQSIQTYKTFRAEIGDSVPQTVKNNIDKFYSYVKGVRDDIAGFNTMQDAHNYTIDKTKLDQAREYFNNLL